MGVGESTRSAGQWRVLPLIAALVTTGLILDFTVLNLHGPASSTAEMAARIVLVGIAFGLCDGVVLHIELGRNAHSVSLGELALTLGLFFLTPGAIPVARVCAGAAVLLLVRRQRLVKVAFNVAVWVLDVAAATAVFDALHGGPHRSGLGLLAPALIACFTAAAIDSVAVNIAISLTGGGLDRRAAARLTLSCLAGGVLSSMLGLVLVGALERSSWLAPAIICAAVAVLLGFRRYGVLRQQHHSVKELYDFTDQLARTPYGRLNLPEVLESVSTLLRTERAALWLSTEGGSWQETVHGMGVERPTLSAAGGPPPARIADMLADPLTDPQPLVILSDDQSQAGAELLQHYGARDAVLVPVRTRQGLPGVLLVLDRLGDVSIFNGDDVRLLQTLAAHVGTALANARLLRKLDHDSTHDGLTGLANRAYFHRRLTEALAAEQSVAVLLMDLNRFKEVNDTLGHHHGDLLLRNVAERLRRSLRAGDLLARLGGDEFAVLTPALDADVALEVARRIRAALTEPIRIEGVDMEVTASVGVALMSPAGDETAPTRAAAAMQQADVAMYRAKTDGTGVQIYEEDLADYSPRRLALASGLRSAIESGQLALRYQPQARLADGVIVGVEALVRWVHPTYGEVPPDDFVGIAEQTGQIRELTRFVINEALRQCAEWNSRDRQLRMSVNLSVRNLLEPDLVSFIADRLDAYGVPPALLTLELTESHLMADAVRMPQVLSDLADIGVQLSVDDFGTGYSSLAYLRRMPMHELKIDKSFVRDISSDSNDAAIVEAIVQLAHALGIHVVAEGIEHAASQRLLRSLGCDLMQGYHLAPPMRPELFSAWLADRQDERESCVRVLPTQRVVPNVDPTTCRDPLADLPGRDSDLTSVNL